MSKKRIDSYAHISHASICCSGKLLYKKVRLKDGSSVVSCAFHLLTCAMIIGSWVPSVSSNRPPRFLIDGQTEIVLRLKESPQTAAGKLIYRLKGYDPDNDPLTFGVRRSADSDVIRIENIGQNHANIYLAKELDREVKDEYSIVLTLTDNRFSDSNYVTQSFLLLVEDINDNAPNFLPYQNAMEISENSSPGIVTVLEATDADEGAYGQVVYYLQEMDGDDEVFSISTYQGKGVLRLLKSLDYETKNLYHLRILAIDRANQGPINTGTAAILIKVGDVEDQSPEFIQVQALSRISENAAIGTRVLRVKAIDGDRGINNPIEYSVEANELFAINRTSGDVFTIRELDREDADNNQVNGAYILKITATELPKKTQLTPFPLSSSSLQQARTEVTIIVTDVNDEIPTFSQPIYRCVVNENSQINTPLSFIDENVQNFVMDRDAGKNGTFRLFLDPQNDLFEMVPELVVNEANFLIRVKNSKMIDYETEKEVNFTLFAREDEEPQRWSSAHVQIFILDQNDNFPEFSKTIYNVSLPENSEMGTVITRIEATDKDSGDFGTMGIRYRNLRGGIAELLHLDPITGVITIESADSAAFDREVISRHYLTVEAIDNNGSGNRNTAQIIINIDDVNDNAAVFIQQRYEAFLLENKPDFETPLILEARDLDKAGTENSQITYEIVDGPYRENFTINPETGVLRLLRPFDFENLIIGESDGDGGNDKMNTKPIYEINLVVRARDSGLPMLSTVVPVVIYIQDINDNSPIFEKNFYSKNILENLPGGSAVLQVKAIDRDASSPNNLIVYRIQSGASDKFIVNAETGVVQVARGASLDPDKTDPRKATYSLTLLALDGGLGVSQLMSSTTVNITIKDVNNKNPILTEMPTIQIEENTPVGSFVYRIKAIDPDESPILRYQLNKKNCEAFNEDGTFVKSTEYDFISLFALDPIEGILSVSKMIDRERVEHLRLAVIVEDMASSTGPQTVEAFLNLQIEDKNDNNPKFKSPFYRRTITENSMNGVLVVQASAYDIDKNKTITYSLQADSIFTGLVHLDTQTGEIVVGNKVDHEMHEWLNFTIRATDSGIPTRSTLADVYISVLDENDNNPYFLAGAKNFTISENAPIGERIGRILAEDADSGDYGKITFLMDRISSQGKFAIDADTGALTVANKLDREVKDFYMLIIEAWDNYQFGFLAGESRNAFKQIFITISDENDSPPEISISDGCVFITEFHDLNEKVTTIRGKDSDDPNSPNGRLVFRISQNKNDDLFELKQIDHWTAQIFARSSLRRKHGNYSIEISVQDRGVPPNIINKTLDICVTDFNDHPPMFVSPAQNTTIRLAENTTVGTMILQVYAKDEDIGRNALVRYRLKPDALGSYKLFEIDSIDGKIFLRLKLDREKQKIHEVRIEAYDQGLPTSLSSDLDLTIYVRNVRDYEPQFLIEEIFVNFTEHSEPGVEMVKLPDTIDKDEVDDLDDPPSSICYFIVKGNVDGYFSLDAETHILTVMRELDREIKAKHILYIKATEICINQSESLQYSIEETRNNQMNSNDRDKILLSDSTIVRAIVQVVDINDNPPKFRSKIFTGGVTTSADFGMKFMKIEAIDLDEGINARINYYRIGDVRQTLSEGLENVHKPPFLVDRITGEIQLNFDPQKGMKGYFDFMVLANDSIGMKDMAHVFIYLLRDDQKVRFVFRLQPIELRERIYTFQQTLSNVTNAIVNIDEFKVHENKDGSVDKTKTDLYMHFVEKEDNSIYDVAEVLNLIDKHIESLDDLFKEFNVIDTQPAEAQLLIGDNSSKGVFVWLVFSNLFMATLLIVALTLCASQRNAYRRQLKAAKINILRQSSLSNETVGAEGISTHVPNTNKHSVEGSNPIWLKGYENDWFKNEENVSQIGPDSLDDNFLAVSSKNLDMLKRPSLFYERGNDLNRHSNFYNQIDHLSNSVQILAKKLETTEL